MLINQVKKKIAGGKVEDSYSSSFIILKCKLALQENEYWQIVNIKL